MATFRDLRNKILGDGMRGHGSLIMQKSTQETSIFFIGDASSDSNIWSPQRIYSIQQSGGTHKLFSEIIQIDSDADDWEYIGSGNGVKVDEIAN